VVLRDDHAGDFWVGHHDWLLIDVGGLASGQASPGRRHATVR
jgi:hypothetical protein